MHILWLMHKLIVWTFMGNNVTEDNTVCTSSFILDSGCAALLWPALCCTVCSNRMLATGVVQDVVIVKRCVCANYNMKLCSVKMFYVACMILSSAELQDGVQNKFPYGDISISYVLSYLYRTRVDCSAKLSGNILYYIEVITPGQRNLAWIIWFQKGWKGQFWKRTNLFFFTSFFFTY